MSADLESTDDVIMCCASCGKAEVDDVKLKNCGCNLVKYCSVDCQRNHRSQHKKACKRRMAEIRDDNLFRQPDESYLGECSICFLSLPLEKEKHAIMVCCSKFICRGCEYANLLRAREQGLEERCPFCREIPPKSLEEATKNVMKRVKVNDPDAMNEMGNKCEREGDFEKAFEYWTNAAELGNIAAHFNLAGLYYEGRGIEKDMKKAVYHLEEAAIGGHPTARYNLGCCEEDSGRVDRAFKHWIIAAKLGYDDALDLVKEGFVDGIVKKEDYAAALRGHQAAVDATKSKQRDVANTFFNI